MAFFSIVIPVYNRAEFIVAALNSVLQQTFEDFEIVVVNDGSTDNTEKIIKSFFDKTSKIKYIEQQNKERGAARNYGFNNSTGKYVLFLDSDDLMISSHLETLHKKITQQNFPNFITTKYVLRRNGVDTVSNLMKNLKEGYYDLGLQLKGALFACNFCVKRDNRSLKLFIEDKKYAGIEDWMFIVQNLQEDKIYVVDVYSIVMIDHDDRSMRGDNQSIIKKHLLATKWIEENISLTAKQVKIVRGHSYHFCAIHNYIDGKKIKSFKYLLMSILLTGMDKIKAALLVKNFIGYGLIQKIK